MRRREQYHTRETIEELKTGRPRKNGRQTQLDIWHLYFCTSDHDLTNLIEANYLPVTKSHCFHILQHSTHCPQFYGKPLHSTCMELYWKWNACLCWLCHAKCFYWFSHAMHSLMLCNSSLISDNLSIYTNFMHASSGSPLMLNICLVIIPWACMHEWFAWYVHPKPKGYRPEGWGYTYQANYKCTRYNCYVPYSPSSGKLEPAQARKHTSLQSHCIYRKDCWDWL